MPDMREFCTCKDTSCPNHPTNHDQGCSLCILKNLRMGEIPGCFFNQVDEKYPGPNYFYKDFAKLVLSKED